MSIIEVERAGNQMSRMETENNKSSEEISYDFDLLEVLTNKVEEFKQKFDESDGNCNENRAQQSSCNLKSLLDDLQVIIDEANQNLESGVEDRYSRTLNGSKRIKMNNALQENQDSANSSSLSSTSTIDKNIQEQSTLDELANEDVLLLIFNYMGSQDLLNFRLVSQKWRSSATSSLLKRNLCLVTLTRKYQPVPIIDSSSPIPPCQYFNDKVRDQNHDPSSLRILNTVIQNSSKFPCKNFRFIDENSDSLCLTTAVGKNSKSKMTAMKMDPEIRKLFSLFGPQIISLSFEGTLFQSDLRHILVNRAPNLEILDLSALENLISSRSKNLFPREEYCNNYNLKLTTLRLGSPFFLDQEQNENTLQELLEAAPNLRGIYNVRMWCLKSIVRCNKVYLIKDLDFDPGADRDDIELIQEFALCEPRLHRLSVNFTYVSSIKRFWPCVVQVLNSILKSSKDTLEFLEVHPLGKIKLVKEMLTRCKVLRIGDDYGHYGYGGAAETPEVSDDDNDSDNSDAEINDNYRNRNHDQVILPQGASFAQNFPQIETIQLDLQYLDEDSINFYFPVQTSNSSSNLQSNLHSPPVTAPTPTTSASVKYLEIYNDWPDYLCTRILSKRFPQLTSLKLACYHASDLSESIWQWQSCQFLESIEIYGVSNGGVGEPVGVPPSVIDSFFTGIPVETCRELKMKRYDKTTAERNIDLLRVKSSICVMKHLRRFKIVFMELRAPFISHVSGFYAFQLMPQLEITFAYDQSKKFSKVAKETERHLEAVAPFVNLVHHKKPTPFSRTLE